MKARSRLARAFTLVEIMIVVLIVGILSSLAIFVVVRIKERVSESIVRNNLRQLYSAVELFYADNPEKTTVGYPALFRDGYISRSLNEAIKSGVSMSAEWHYRTTSLRNSPVWALQGRPTPVTVDRPPPPGQVIMFYPEGAFGKIDPNATPEWQGQGTPKRPPTN